MIGKALARVFHDLPELSDDFVKLLKDLRSSAPDEDLMSQVRVASNLTDTPLPESEALKRMVDYANLPKNDYARNRATQPTTNLLSPYREFGRPSPQATPASAAQARIEKRIGRPLSKAERQQLGSLEPFDRGSYSSLNMRTLLQGALERSKPQTTRKIREEAQRRMALEYLLGEAS